MIPDRLAALLAQESLPWNEAEEWHIDEFLRAFTLHDSHWLGLQFDVAWDGFATAAIAFDPVWNKIGEEATSTCAKWPTLFIRFPNTQRVSKENYADVGGVQRGISEVTVKQAEDAAVETFISDHYGGRISIRHSPRISTLCYSSRGQVVGSRNKIIGQGPAPLLDGTARSDNARRWGLAALGCYGSIEFHLNEPIDHDEPWHLQLSGKGWQLIFDVAGAKAVRDFSKFVTEHTNRKIFAEYRAGLFQGADVAIVKDSEFADRFWLRICRAGQMAEITFQDEDAVALDKALADLVSHLAL